MNSIRHAYHLGNINPMPLSFADLFLLLAGTFFIVGGTHALAFCAKCKVSHSITIIFLGVFLLTLGILY